MSVAKQEQVAFGTHLFGFGAAIAGTIFLALLTRESGILLFLSLVYGFSLMFLFLASSLYHAHKKSENEVSIWRKLDHIAIYFMIAGTYTPFCYIYLTGYWRWGIIGTQWFLVVTGLFFKLFYLQAPRWIVAGIYLIMGWLTILPIRQLAAAMPGTLLAYLFAGGMSFSIGAIFYALKKPNPIPGYFGFHEIFHVLILVGGFLHYLLIVASISHAMGVS